MDRHELRDSQTGDPELKLYARIKVRLPAGRFGGQVRGPGDLGRPPPVSGRPTRDAGCAPRSCVARLERRQHRPRRRRPSAACCFNEAFPPDFAFTDDVVKKAMRPELVGDLVDLYTKAEVARAWTS